MMDIIEPKIIQIMMEEKKPKKWQSENKIEIVDLEMLIMEILFIKKTLKKDKEKIKGNGRKMMNNRRSNAINLIQPIIKIIIKTI